MNDISYNIQTILLEHVYYSSLIYECPHKILTQSKGRKKLGDILLDETDRQKETYKNFINEFTPSGEIVEYNSNTRDVQYGIIRNDKAESITVVFRGSESILDWYHDIIVFKKPITRDKKIKVHKGFYLQLFNDNLYYTIKNKLLNMKLCYPKYQIYATGHSAGAALATLFSYYFANTMSNRVFKMDKENIRCITFASPRIGNKAFQENFNDHKNIEHLRCFNSKDILCAVPNYKYYHTGSGVKMKKGKTTIFFDKGNKNQYNKTLFKFWRIKEHFSINYIERIKNNEFIFIE